ncbi:histone-lysine N-methyltransferase 2D-like [Ochlerotatus camptorhynchus]|uniref:histone-lysine N-methyltransferase 2D-like n=1 Tax=Ochlerotatus camptorhynchus TaxID=644619 RepID=UPI0031DCA21E
MRNFIPAFLRSPIILFPLIVCLYIQNPAPITPKPIFGESASGPSPSQSTIVPPPKPPPQPPLQPPPLIRQLYAKPIIAPQVLDLPKKPPLQPGPGQFTAFKPNAFPSYQAPVYYQPGARQIMSQNGPGPQRPPNPSMSPQNMRPMGPPMHRPGAPPINRPPGPPGASIQYQSSPNIRPPMPIPQQQQLQQPGMQRPPMAQNMRPTTPQQVRGPNLMPQNVRPSFSPQNSTAGLNQPIRPGAPLVRPPNVGQPQPPLSSLGSQQNRPAPIPQQIINNRPPSMPFRSPVQMSNLGDHSGSERESPETLSRMQSDLSLGKVDSPRSSYLSTDDDEDVVIGKITPLASLRTPEGQLSPTLKSSTSAPFNRSDSQMSISSRPPSGLGNYVKTTDTLRTAQSPQTLQSTEIVYKEKHMISTEKSVDSSGSFDRDRTPEPSKVGHADQSNPTSRAPSTDNISRPSKPIELGPARSQPPAAMGKSRQISPTTPSADRVTFVLPDETNGGQNSEPMRKTPVPPNFLKKLDAETRGHSPFRSNLSVDQDHSSADNSKMKFNNHKIL